MLKINILILTSIYPQDDDEKNIGVTPVVQYFAKDWVKLGHNVIVIHNSSKYPKLFYLIPDKFLKLINSKLGIVIPNKKQGINLKSINDGVTSYRLPMLKIIPKNKFSNRQIDKQFIKITDILKEDNFEPDLILGHWENPQLPLLSLLKIRYKKITAIVFHGIVYINQKRYHNWGKEYIKNIDVVGARSNPISDSIKKLLELEQKPFICHSGINYKYFDISKGEVQFKKKKSNSYLYVGRLIKRKNVEVSIASLKKIYDDSDFSFNILGSGAEKKNFENIIKAQKLENHVKLLGHKSRDEVIEIMSETEVFIMISDNETFGLVYIEAMSRGCIIIASKNGGMDGIIENGYNGFLCHQGNEKELTNIIGKINSLSLIDKERISENAINTAREYSDSKAAKRYLSNVLGNKEDS